MAQLASLISELSGVRAAMVRTDRDCAAYLRAIPGDQQASARNLLHYLALRRHDLRHAQLRLASHGLSSLGRTESHVRNGLETVLGVLHMLEGLPQEAASDTPPLTKDAGEVLLASHTDALFGPSPDGRSVRIMVTMPGEAATDYLLIRGLVAAGMDCMRINCAHDDAASWGRMIEHLRRANAELRTACRLSMDIGGPKLRTGTLTPGAAVLKIKPQRDPLGRTVRPALVALLSAANQHNVPCAVDAVLRLDGDPPADVAAGQVLEFDDARGKSCRLPVRVHEGAIVVAELARTAYVVPGTVCRFDTPAGATTRRVVDVPPREDNLLLKKGDTLLLTPDSIAGRPAVLDEHDRVMMPASIGITLPEVFRDVQCGESIWFDDGKIGGIVRATQADQIAVEITQAGPAGSRLAAGKGVNLPDTRLGLSPLTPRDLDGLPFIAQHADLIGYSFVRQAEDVYQLQQRLADLNARQIGIVLKIETRQAFAELPKLLLACMHAGRFGVMIARGDLAVECGFERMAEVQEEILWICEAAHTPVIWATQVLESLAKKGRPSRAEVTDAAMSERAECVMLNKGPFIRDAVKTLDDILRRMQAHQTKKRAMLRPLQLAHSVLTDLAHSQAVGATRGRDIFRVAEEKSTAARQ
jgi:pyruvate kinase